MARLPRQAKLAAKPIIDVESSEDSDMSDTEIDPSQPADFFKAFKDIKDEPDYISQDSDFEQGPKKRKHTTTARLPVAKKIKLSTRKTRHISPEIPPMSDEEHDGDREDDRPLYEKPRKSLQQGSVATGVKVTALPKLLRIEVFNAPTTININLADLFPGITKRLNEDQDLDGSTLLDDSMEGSSIRSTRSARAATPESFVEMRANPKYACFLELEPELRNRIYRQTLVRDSPVKFNPTPDLSRTAALLRTCRQVNREAADILYGENAFHLDRTSQRRGTLYNSTWREIGYKDMRRFVETIGQENLSRIRFLSIAFTDATPAYTTELTAEERRFWNDPVLYHILKLIGNSGALLEKFVVGFAGRGQLDAGHMSFVRALTSIKCHKLIRTCCWGHSRIEGALLINIEKFMTEPRLDNVDTDRQKAPRLQHELDNRSYGCGMWSCRSH